MCISSEISIREFNILCIYISNFAYISMLCMHMYVYLYIFIDIQMYKIPDGSATALLFGRGFLEPLWMGEHMGVSQSSFTAAMVYRQKKSSRPDPVLL